MQNSSLSTLHTSISKCFFPFSLLANQNPPIIHITKTFINKILFLVHESLNVCSPMSSFRFHSLCLSHRAGFHMLSHSSQPNTFHKVLMNVTGSSKKLGRGKWEQTPHSKVIISYLYLPQSPNFIASHTLRCLIVHFSLQPSGLSVFLLHCPSIFIYYYAEMLTKCPFPKKKMFMSAVKKMFSP